MGKIKSVRIEVDKLLNELYIWTVVATSDSPEDVAHSSDTVDKMFVEGEMPWDEDAEGTHLYLGRKFYFYDETRQRCDEELVRLPVEKRRLGNWLQDSLDIIEQALIDSRPTLTPSTPSESLIERHITRHFECGKRTVLLRHKHDLESLKASLSDLDV